ncbi:hypothetical protein ANO14919_004630 [Xylariales sp. No.14919]|nr:hypothetical protein ANO14919_004630 [Xylariales sp. No.14919]
MATQKSAAHSRSALTATQTAPTSISVAEAEPEEATPYSQALCRLEPLHPVLAGFAHRNHNQHRRAAWWRCFGMLRRNYAKLVEELVSAIAATRKNAARAARTARVKSKKRRREELVSGDLGTRGKDGLAAQELGVDVEANANVAKHATWLRDILIPKCYLAFSQLTADSQFAPLGVVLLGILAQIQAVCDTAAPRRAAPPASPRPALNITAVAEAHPPSVEDTTIVPKDESTAVLSTSEPGSKTNQGQTPPKGKKESRCEKDGGRTISREDVERVTELGKKGNETRKIKVKRDAKTANTTDRAKSSTPSKASEVTAAILPSKGQMYSAQEGGGDELVRPVKKMKIAVVAKEKERGTSDDKDKKKKKKAKKGDEFDDLFKGLF